MQGRREDEIDGTEVSLKRAENRNRCYGIRRKLKLKVIVTECVLVTSNFMGCADSCDVLHFIAE